MNLLVIAIAGAIGAPSRFLVERSVTRWIEARFAIAPFEGSFPWGTAVVNLTGSFILGVISGLFEIHRISTLSKLALGTGFCGAYTTFSTFTLQSVRLGRAGAWWKLLANSVVVVAVGLLMATAGLEAVLGAFG